MLAAVPRSLKSSQQMVLTVLGIPQQNHKSGIFVTCLPDFINTPSVQKTGPVS